MNYLFYLVERMNLLLKISRKLKELAFKLNSLSIYLELKYFIKHNESYIFPIHRHYRAVGKTYNLIKLSIKLNVPIFVSSHSAECYIKQMAKKKFNKNVSVFVFYDEIMRGKRFDKILIDEGFTYKQLCKIKESCGCVVGFTTGY